MGTIRLTLLALFFFSSAAAITEDDLLPVDEAFVVSAEALGPDRVRVTWRIADGYYLYRHRISFLTASGGVELGEPVLPAGKEYEDEFFGRVETYRHELNAEIPVVRAAGAPASIEIEARSQGCADLGVCYPPHRQFVTVALAETDGLSLGGGSGLSLLDPPGTGPGPGLALENDPLPEDQAFRFEAIALGPRELLLRWTIAPGYYLYRDQIALEVDPDAAARLGEPGLPPGEVHHDEHFGDVIVYRGQVEVPLGLARQRSDAGPLRLTGHYRGCKDDSICYPPIARTLAVDLPPAETLAPDAGELRVGAVAVIDSPPEPGATRPPLTAKPPSPATTGPGPEPEQDRLARALDEKGWLTLVSFFGFGLLLAFTPCVFPMIPILSGIIAGQGREITTAKAFTLSLVYVLAMALTYTAAGVIAGLFGQNLQAAFQNAWVLGGFSLVFVLLALSMFGFYELQLPSALQTRLNRLSNRQSGGTLAGVAVMGFLSALIVGPCVAPPLAAALIYIGQSGDAVLGGMALFALSLGMGAPLVLVGTGAGRWLPRAGAWMDAVKAVFGVALLGLALWILERIAPPALIMLGWGTLLCAAAVYLGALERLPDQAGGWRKLWKSLGVVLLVAGVLEFVGAAAGGRDWLQPLKGVLEPPAPAGAVEPVTFTRVKSLAELEATLAEGSRPAVLDFYADWCVDCKRMDRYTFPEPPVQAALAGGLALKADVTANDDLDQELMRHFGIIGPPAILFFDADGREMRGYRVIGYQKPEAFAEHVRSAFEAGGGGRR